MGPASGKNGLTGRQLFPVRGDSALYPSLGYFECVRLSSDAVKMTGQMSPAHQPVVTHASRYCNLLGQFAQDRIIAQVAI